LKVGLRKIRARRHYHHSPFWKKIAASAFLVMWNTFFKWKIAKLDCFRVLFQERSDENTGLNQISFFNFFQTIFLIIFFKHFFFKYVQNYIVL